MRLNGSIGSKFSTVNTLKGAGKSKAALYGKGAAGVVISSNLYISIEALHEDVAPPPPNNKWY